jgi:cytochrome c oxidase cbb3-type subunit 3
MSVAMTRLLFVLLYFSLIAVKAEPLPTTILSAPNPNLGKILFQQNCAVCHGREGNGGVGIPLNLADFLNTASDHYLQQTIKLGRPGRIMPAFNHLTSIQINNIIAYIRSWQKNTTIPYYSTELIIADRHKGQHIYQRICSHCHRDKGIGGKGTGVTFSRPRDAQIIAPAIANPAFLQSASDQMIKRIIMTGRNSTPMSSAKSMGLTETDVNNVVAYLRSLMMNETITPAPKKHTTENVILIFESSYSIKETIKNLKAASIAYNFRYIREQTLNQGFVAKANESNEEYLIYFCNFSFLNQALSIDPRIGMFLPFRTTIVKQENKVLVMTVNPNYLCSLFNNAELKQGCEFMAEKYEAILEEGTL